MGLTIDVLPLGDIELDSAFLVKGRPMGTVVSAPAYGFLIRGGSQPILVDTGYRNAEVLGRIGMTAARKDEQDVASQLARFNLGVEDVRLVMTHLHADHAGHVDAFPMSSAVVINRTDLMFACSGMQGPLYAPEDVHHVLDRVYTPGAVQFLDLESSGPVRIAEGVTCELNGGHAPGTMNVLVETDEGTACIVGDCVYDVQDQLVAPAGVLAAEEPQLSNNTAVSTVDERASIKRALNYDWILPSHDMPARCVGGRVVGRPDALVVPSPVRPPVAEDSGLHRLAEPAGAAM